MKFLFLTMVMLAFEAFATEWSLDKSHSTIGFSIDHLMISETTGSFKDYSLNVKSLNPDFTDAAFEVQILTSSIDTQDAKRDEHLRGSDFFNVEKHPHIVFKGKRFEKRADGTYKVHGTLSMNGTEKPLVLNGVFGGIVKDPWGGTRAGLKVFGKINRYDFGLKYNTPLDADRLAIGKDVRLIANIELIKK